MQNHQLSWWVPVLTVIVAMLASVITLILTALSIAREREMGTFDQLIVSPLSSIDILAGKTVPPLIIAMALTCVMTFVVNSFFGMPFEDSVFLFLISMLISLLSLVGVGLYISSICRTQQQAILGVITFMMPAVLLSGFISPIEDMPVFLQYLTLLNPINPNNGIKSLKTEGRKAKLRKKKNRSEAMKKDITRLFCLVDDFLKALEEERKNKQIEEGKKRRNQHLSLSNP